MLLHKTWGEDDLGHGRPRLFFDVFGSGLRRIRCQRLRGRCPPPEPLADSKRRARRAGLLRVVDRFSYCPMGCPVRPRLSSAVRCRKQQPRHAHILCNGRHVGWPEWVAFVLELVAFGLYLPFGSVEDPKALPGLVNYTVSMLQEGTSKHTSKEIAELL